MKKLITLFCLAGSIAANLDYDKEVIKALVLGIQIKPESQSEITQVVKAHFSLISQKNIQDLNQEEIRKIANELKPDQLQYWISNLKDEDKKLAIKGATQNFLKKESDLILREFAQQILKIAESGHDGKIKEAVSPKLKNKILELSQSTFSITTAAKLPGILAALKTEIPRDIRYQLAEGLKVKPADIPSIAIAKLRQNRPRL